MKPTPIIVLGGRGRLGSAIVEAARQDTRFSIKGIVEPEPKGAGEWPKLAAAKPSQGDVVIDATLADAVRENLIQAASLKTPYVLPVTGYDDAVREDIRKAARTIPIVVAANLSVGVAVLDDLLRRAAALLPDADIEIVETHHRMKTDAPSGTALALADSVKDVLKGTQVKFSRPPKGERTKGSLAIHSVRGGDVVGTHRVFFLMDSERIELAHEAGTRAIFARGALEAARFVATQPPGLYAMKDVLEWRRRP